ncbi:hypothetical protein J6590_077584 [Homalodisca vitripennis]|nr:hypothetical protein J6590_077584 [Homalodisca vitripennis]
MHSPLRCFPSCVLTLFPLLLQRLNLNVDLQAGYDVPGFDTPLDPAGMQDALHAAVKYEGIRKRSTLYAAISHRSARGGSHCALQSATGARQDRLCLRANSSRSTNKYLSKLSRAGRWCQESLTYKNFLPAGVIDPTNSRVEVRDSSTPETQFERPADIGPIYTLYNYGANVCTRVARLVVEKRGRDLHDCLLIVSYMLDHYLPLL